MKAVIGITNENRPYITIVPENYEEGVKLRLMEIAVENGEADIEFQEYVVRDAR